MLNRPLVSIIISNVNGKEVLRECLNSISKLEYTNYEIIVIDSGSTDGSSEMLRTEFPWVKTIKIERMGLAKCNNIGFKHSKGDLVVIDLNNDDVVDSKWLTRLVDYFMVNDDVGAVCGTRIIYGSNDIVESMGGKINYWTGQTPGNYSQKRFHEVPKEPFNVDYLPVILTSRDIYESLGGCDEDYYIYFEDTDLSLQISRLGLNLTIVPTAIFYHKGSSTVGKMSYYGYYMLLRNRFRFIIKNFNIYHLLSSIYCNMFIFSLMDILLSIDIINKIIQKIMSSKKSSISKRRNNWVFRGLFHAWIWNISKMRNTLRARYILKGQKGYPK